MATLATTYHRLLGTSERAAHPRTAGPSMRVPAYANADVFFYVKRIDNEGVIRAADPQAGGTCWKLIGSAGVAVLLLIAVLLPSAYGLLAGYQIESLRKESQRLATEQAALELQETRLLSPQRMEELARMQQFIDPPSAKVVYLDDRAGSLAMNKK